MTTVAIYADGGVVKVNPSPIGGVWAFCHVDELGEREFTRVGHLFPHEVGGPVTNNQSEFLAVLEGLEWLPAGWTGTVYSDSWVTLQRFFCSAPLRNIPTAWQERMGKALRSLGPMQYVLLDGHPTRAQLAEGVGKRGHPVSKHQVHCDEQCTYFTHLWTDTLKRQEELDRAAAAILA